MLTLLRDGAKSGFTKFILLGFMAMAVGGLVLTDVGGFFTGGGVRGNNVVSIDGQKLPMQQFDNTVRRVLAQQNLDAQTAYRLGFIDQILYGEINNNLLARNSQDIGLNVNDQIVAKQIKTLVEPHVSDELPAQEVLRRILRSQNMTERQLVESIKSEMTSTLIRNALISNAPLVSKGTQKALFQYRNEKRSISYVVFENSAFKDVADPTEEDLTAFYERSKQKFVIPETRVVSYVSLSPKNLEDTLDISEEELRQVYQADLELYTDPEQRELEQAIFEDEATAQSVLTRVQDGESLKKAIENEQISADTYVGTDRFERKGLIEDLANAVFEAGESDVVGPVETPLGFHVAIVQSIKETNQRSFEDVRESIREFLLQDRLLEELFVISGEIDDAFAGGSSLEDVAEAFELDIKTLSPMRQDGSTPGDTDAMKGFSTNDISFFLENTFELNEGEISPVIELEDGSFVAIRLDSINDQSFKAFEDVKDQLKKDWIEKERILANAQKASGYLDDLNNGDLKLSTVAKENGLTMKTEDLSRFGETPEPLTASAKNRFFQASEKEYTLATIDSGFVLAKINSITLPDFENANEDQLEDSKSRLVQSNNSEFVQVYLNHLFETSGVKINRDLLTQTYGAELEQ